MPEEVFTKQFLLELLVNFDMQCNYLSITRLEMSRPLAEKITARLLPKLNERAAEFLAAQQSETKGEML